MHREREYFDRGCCLLEALALENFSCARHSRAYNVTPSRAITTFISSQTSRFALGLRSKYAG